MRRSTIQSALVYETVKKLKFHATADEIYTEILKKHPTISRATVYRNLNRLAEEGKIKRISVADGADCFDHLCHNHYHIKCEKCGRVFDVDMNYIPDLAKQIKNTHGFCFTGHSIMFSGLCPECAK